MGITLCIWHRRTDALPFLILSGRCKPLNIKKKRIRRILSRLPTITWPGVISWISVMHRNYRIPKIWISCWLVERPSTKRKQFSAPLLSFRPSNHLKPAGTLSPSRCWSFLEPTLTSRTPMAGLFYTMPVREASFRCYSWSLSYGPKARPSVFFWTSWQTRTTTSSISLPSTTTQRYSPTC